MQVRVRTASGSLQSGDKVKVSIRFRGRMITHSDVGLRCDERGSTRESRICRDGSQALHRGRTMTMMLSPKQDK